MEDISNLFFDIGDYCIEPSESFDNMTYLVMDDANKDGMDKNMEISFGEAEPVSNNANFEELILKDKESISDDKKF